MLVKENYIEKSNGGIYEIKVSGIEKAMNLLQEGKYEMDKEKARTTNEIYLTHNKNLKDINQLITNAHTLIKDKVYN